MISASARHAIDSYVSKIKKNPEILGVFLVGSYATGQFSETSDVDIKIILQPQSFKHFKGVERIDSYEISYSAYSIMEAYHYFYTQLRSYSKFQARMLSQGTILYDATGEMKHLQDEAHIVMQKPFIKPHISALQLEGYKLSKYKEALLHKDLGIYFHKEYHVFLENALILHTKLLEMECIFQYPFFKMDVYINDATFREIYQIPEYPSPEFLEAYQQGIQLTSIYAMKQTVQYMFQRIEDLLQMDFEAFEIAN
jgi:hypothetical protein